MTEEWLNAIMKYVDCKVALEVANHENSAHEEYECTPVEEKRDLKAAEAELRALLTK